MSYDSMLLGWTTCHRMVYRQCGNLIFETLAGEENLENPATNPPISKSANPQIRQSSNAMTNLHSVKKGNYDMSEM